MRNQLLRDADWASMAHSVEVRTPLVDASLLRQLAPLLLEYGAACKQLPRREPRRPGCAAAEDRLLRPDRRSGSTSRQTARTRADAELGARRAGERRGENPPLSHRRVRRLRRHRPATTATRSKRSRSIRAARRSSSLPRIVPQRSWKRCRRKSPSCAKRRGGAFAYVGGRCAARAAAAPFDLVICGHINLLPVARLSRSSAALRVRDRGVAPAAADVEPPASCSARHHLHQRDHARPPSRLVAVTRGDATSCRTRSTSSSTASARSAQTSLDRHQSRTESACC